MICACRHQHETGPSREAEDEKQKAWLRNLQRFSLNLSVALKKAFLTQSNSGGEDFIYACGERGHVDVLVLGNKAISTTELDDRAQTAVVICLSPDCAHRKQRPVAELEWVSYRYHCLALRVKEIKNREKWWKEHLREATDRKQRALDKLCQRLRDLFNQSSRRTAARDRAEFTMRRTAELIHRNYPDVSVEGLESIPLNNGQQASRLREKTIPCEGCGQLYVDLRGVKRHWKTAKGSSCRPQQTGSI